MAYYGFAITAKGRALIAKLVAGKKLALTRVMVGSGCCPETKDPRSLTDLVAPVAAATSTSPIYEHDTVRMTIEYRSDLNGGLSSGFWLREFGVFATDPDNGEILLYYGCLGDYPQWVSAASASGVDVRRFPVCIAIGDDSGVTVSYNCEAWMTAEDVAEYGENELLPMCVSQADLMIITHDNNWNAHQPIRNTISALDTRVALLELKLDTNVTGNPFVVTFESPSGVNMAGVWNVNAERIEF